ncbi:MAG: AarF/ABC1/UbiB kinase family protein [Planctomycetes bacterium]|nr:AarF/ABC1/UbiB kinase family protein [Planctomycetota bacterium]
MTTFAPIARRIQHVQRYVQVLEVLARNGFGDLAQQLGLDTLIDRGRSFLGGKSVKGHEQVPHLARIRKVLEELGPTYVKMGQVLSTRPDLIPQDLADEFKKLQNDVPGVDYEVIHASLEAEFPGQLKHLFRSITKKPLAAGSIAQVHRARLHDGTQIVLKVLRPGIRELTAIDMEILRTLAELVEKHFSNLGYSPTKVVNEFAKELKHEVDLTDEARSTERLGNFFIDDADIVFPKVYWEATTTNVLALEEVHGIVLAGLKDGQIGAADRRKLVENGARAVFLQCLDHGFFHADPHPGNLIALPGGRIAFIDCGMTGQVDARTSRQLAELVTGVVAGDVDRVLAVAGALGDVDGEKLEDRELRADVQGILAEFQGTPLDRLNLGKVLQNFFATLRAHKIQCPADIMLLIKALSTIESVGRDLDPSFEMSSFVRPYLERLVNKRYTPSAILGRLRRSLLQYAELAEELPGELHDVITQLRRNKLAINLEHKGLGRLTSTIEHASRNISFALIIAAMFVGSSILILANRDQTSTGLSLIGFAGFLAASVLVVLMIVSNRKNRGG